MAACSALAGAADDLSAARYMVKDWSCRRRNLKWAYDGLDGDGALQASVGGRTLKIGLLAMSICVQKFGDVAQSPATGPVAHPRSEPGISR